jgi:ABC-type lipoprotein export system ATPase subunit
MTEKAANLTTTSSRDALLDLEAITLTYPGWGTAAPIELLRGIDLSVAPGELLVVAGRSGSGKTTLLNIAAGLTRPSGGIVRWSGERIDRLSRDELARRRGRFIGFVFQNAALIETLTTVENVALGGVPSGIRDGGDRAMALLERFGLRPRADHFPAHLSGGEQQRAAVARALYTDPPLLIVDEPTANLDRHTADATIELLAGLAGANRGLLVASHDAHLIAAATRAVELEPSVA